MAQHTRCGECSTVQGVGCRVLGEAFRTSPRQRGAACQERRALGRLGCGVPLTSEHVTQKIVKTRCWPQLSEESHLKPFKVFPLRSEAVELAWVQSAGCKGAGCRV